MDAKSGDDAILRLLEQIQKGSGKGYDEACQRLYELYHRRLGSFFRRLGFTGEESTDLTQDVFLRVFKRIDTFRGESRFERWLFEVAANVFRNEVRRRKAEKRGVEQPLEPDAEGDPSGKRREPVAPDPSTEDGLIRQEQLKAFREALEGLPAQMRRCCELRYVRQLKYQEIAIEMKISIETVKAHLFQARKRLATELGERLGKGRTR